MQLPALLTSDLHLTSNPRDEYRWTLFDFLEDQCRVEQVKTLCILGDTTDAKDYHSATLINRVVEQVTRIKQRVKQVIILMGNHDYLKRGHAYLSFLSHIPGVRFVSEIWEDTLTDGPSTLWLPHTKTPEADWKDLDTTHYNYIFMHQTVGGAVASNGQRMEGEGVPDLTAWGKVYSGDIHVPQIIKGVEYVGSPYPVHFGDTFSPRCVLLDSRNRAVDLHHTTIARRMITVPSLRELKRIEFHPGDQVKLRMELNAEDKHDWSRIRRLAMEHLKHEQVEVHGLELRVQTVGARLMGEAPRTVIINPADEVLRFCVAQELGGDALDEALEIVG